MLGIIALIIKLGIQASKKQPNTNSNGDIIITAAKLYGIIWRVGFVCVLGFCIRVVIWSKWRETPKIEEIVWIASIIIWFSFMSAYLVLLSINTKTIVNDKMIINTNRLWKEQTIKWEDISKITFGKISQTLKIYDSKNSVGTHRHSTWFDKYIEKIKQKVDPKFYEEALKNYQEIKQNYGVED